MTAVLKDDTELFKQFMDNESFKRWLTDTVFGLTYDQSRPPGSRRKNAAPEELPGTAFSSSMSRYRWYAESPLLDFSRETTA